MHPALVVVDMQNDFVDPKGALYVHGAEGVVNDVNNLALKGKYDMVVATKDWHRKDDPSFKGYGGSWPPHCVKKTWGAEFAPRLDWEPFDMILHKTGYSAFESEFGVTTGLEHFLRANWVSQVDVCGVAYDYCVMQSALSANRIGFATRVCLWATRAVEPMAVDSVSKQLKREGIGLVEAYP